MRRKGKTVNAMNKLLQTKITCKTLLQRLFITLQFAGENGLANHAAACAYGFLLSAAPLLLIALFLIFRAFQASPHSIITLIKNIPFLEIAVDEQWLAGNFYSMMLPGLSGLAAILSLIWAGRLLAVSLQRGLKIIFTGTKKRNPLITGLVTLAVELPALLLSLAVIFSSRTALRLYETFNFIPQHELFVFLTSKKGYFVFSAMALGIVTYCAYRLIPANAPRRIPAFGGAVFCILLYEFMSMILRIMLGQSMYNFLYGTLGNLITLLINVYFFFLFFLMGGQLAYVSDYFDSILFIKMRQARMKMSENSHAKFFLISNVINRLFLSVEGSLQKYYRFHKKGETVFFEKDKSDEIYYILEGEVEALILSAPNSYTRAGTLGADSFFGEMGYLLSEDRSATIRAKTDVRALAFPPRIFEDILRHDASLDRTLIENLYRSLKNKNARLASLESPLH
ncbi:MAG: YihY/virulence factor BrkB family protein [Treponema sp.]|jgi:membrane protein|nr:YihY/virulence factor BrkB family protein [Treponema sp.]